MSWLPGLSSGAATAVAQLLSRGRREGGSVDAAREFMVALGSVSTSTSLFTVAVLFVIDRARSGAAVAIRELGGGTVSPWNAVASPPALLLALVAAACIAALGAYPVTIACSRLLARRIHKIRYDVLARGVIVALALLIAVLAGAAGLMISVVACVLGLVPAVTGVKRVHLMGCLILPVVAYYSGVV